MSSSLNRDLDDLVLSSQDTNMDGDKIVDHGLEQNICSVCRKATAFMKCKKRHENCKTIRFCNAVCERQQHKKRNDDVIIKEGQKEDKSPSASDMDSAFAKEAKKEKRKQRKITKSMLRDMHIPIKHCGFNDTV